VQRKQLKEEELMDQAQVFGKVVEILTPYVKNEAALVNIKPDANILDDLKVNSARLIDVVLAFEDEFGIEVNDDEVDSVTTVGDAVKLICSKLH
jgi:acyl carrier protein